MNAFLKQYLKEKNVQESAKSIEITVVGSTQRRNSAAECYCVIQRL